LLILNKKEVEMTTNESFTLYVGILTHEHGEEAVTSGTDYDTVFKTTESAYHNLLAEKLKCSVEEAILTSTCNYTRFFVVNTQVSAPKAEPTPTPKWYDEAIQHLSPSDMASHVLECWGMDCLISNAHFHLEKSYEDPEEYLYCLENGHIVPELEKDDGKYDSEFLENLAEEADRKVEEYEDNDELVILDALKHRI
jgi:hypothetical protein